MLDAINPHTIQNSFNTVYQKISSLKETFSQKINIFSSVYSCRSLFSSVKKLENSKAIIFTAGLIIGSLAIVYFIKQRQKSDQPEEKKVEPLPESPLSARTGSKWLKEEAAKKEMKQKQHKKNL